MSKADANMERVPHIRTNQPAIRLKLGEEMSINKKVFHALNNPEHICFWWEERRRVLFIGAVEEESALSFKVSNGYYTSKTGFRIERMPFLQAVMNIAGWNKNMICVTIGEYIPDINMVAFRLDGAEVKEFNNDVTDVVCLSSL